MRRLALLVVLAIIILGLPLLGLSDTVISSDNAVTPHNEASSSISEAINSSASVRITITMYTGNDE